MTHDTNILGGVYGLTVLTPILPGREAALREYLESLGKGLESPLAALPETHFARWVIIPRFAYQGPPQRPESLRSQHLLFSSTFDGPRDLYLDRLMRLIPVHVEEIWGKCAGYPGPISANPEGVKRYMVHNQLTTGLFFAPYAHATVPQVREAIERRRRLRRFLTKRHKSPRELQAAFAETFPLDWRPAKPCPDPLSAGP